MRHIPQTNYGRIDRSFGAMQRLMFENARLNNLCMEARNMAAQYELMLREGDHRIKNSLQVVASLLGLQARRETSDAARAGIHAAAARIQAVARIHDALQLDGGGAAPDIGALIATMSASLRDMAGAPLSIEIIVRVQPIKVPLTLAQPLVLAVNELVLNALRHAFPDGRRGAIMVTVTRDCDGVRITVSDNGVGLPPGYADGRGYGMTLVRAMIAKIDGRLDVKTSSGARFTLSAPLARPTASSAQAHAAADPSQAMAAC
jgi:two-component sensor histidine kinase